MRVPLVTGTPMIDVQRRMRGRGFWFPTPSPDGVVSASSSRATGTATADAVAHTKGAWTELVAATTQDATMITLTLSTATSVTNTNSSTLLDIGIGAAGSEVVLVENLAVGYRASGDRYDIPVLIERGSRIAVRCQSVITAKTVSVAMVLGLLPFGRRPANNVLTMGADTATSKGVALPGLGAANTKSAWVEIEDSVLRPLDALLIGEQGNADAAFDGAGAGALLDIGIGAAGSEQVLLANLGYFMSGLEQFTPHGERNYPVTVPMGSRLAARWQCSSTSNSMDLILYGVPRS